MASTHQNSAADEHEENEDVPEEELFIGDDAAEEVPDDGDTPMDEDDGPGGEGEDGEGEEIVWEDNSVMASFPFRILFDMSQYHILVLPRA